MRADIQERFKGLVDLNGVDIGEVSNIKERVEWLIDSGWFGHSVCAFMREYLIDGADEILTDRYDRLVEKIWYLHDLYGFELLETNWVEHYNSVKSMVGGNGVTHKMSKVSPDLSELTHLLSPKVIAVLSRNGYKNINDLKGLAYEDLLDIKGIGLKNVNQVVKAAKMHGIRIDLRIHME